MRGMCDLCYSSGEELALTEVEGTVNSPLGSVLIPICKKCKKEQQTIAS